MKSNNPFCLSRFVIRSLDSRTCGEEIPFSSWPDYKFAQTVLHQEWKEGAGEVIFKKIL